MRGGKSNDFENKGKSQKGPLLFYYFVLFKKIMDFAETYNSISCHAVIANGLCAQLCERIFPQLTHVSHVIKLECTSKKSMGTGSSNSAEWETLERDHRAYSSLFRAITVFKPCDCLAGAISASSTDNYPEESIVNTLLPGDVIHERASYWSSTGQSDPQVPEMLIYKLRSDFCAITEVSIKPFQGHFFDFIVIIFCG